MNTKETLNADTNEINSLFFNQIKTLTSKNLSSFDAQFSAWGDKMKYESDKEVYSNEVCKLLVANELICAEDFGSFKNYLLGAA